MGTVINQSFDRSIWTINLSIKEWMIIIILILTKFYKEYICYIRTHTQSVVVVVLNFLLQWKKNKRKDKKIQFNIKISNSTKLNDILWIQKKIGHSRKNKCLYKEIKERKKKKIYLKSTDTSIDNNNNSIEYKCKEKFFIIFFSEKLKLYFSTILKVNHQSNILLSVYIFKI